MARAFYVVLLIPSEGRPFYLEAMRLQAYLEPLEYGQRRIRIAQRARQVGVGKYHDPLHLDLVQSVDDVMRGRVDDLLRVILVELFDAGEKDDAVGHFIGFGADDLLGHPGLAVRLPADL